MAALTIPITVSQLLDVVRQLSADERRMLIDTLLAERFDAVLTEADRRRADQPELTDEEIQAEVDSVRRQHCEERHRAAGG
jgi:hypothetical protein